LLPGPDCLDLSFITGENGGLADAKV
jgi:hypothetical protein